MTRISVMAPAFGLSPDRALLLALRRLATVGLMPLWDLYSDTRPAYVNRETPTFERRATLRGAFRKDR